MELDWVLIAVLVGGIPILVSLVRKAWKWYLRLQSGGEKESLQDRIDKIAKGD